MICIDGYKLFSPIWLITNIENSASADYILLRKFFLLVYWGGCGGAGDKVHLMYSMHLKMKLNT